MDGVRFTLRLSFRDWSRAVDKPDGLVKARAWIALAERMVNGNPIALPTNDDLVRDLLLFGRSAALVKPDGTMERVDA